MEGVEEVAREAEELVQSVIVEEVGVEERNSRIVSHQTNPCLKRHWLRSRGSGDNYRGRR